MELLLELRVGSDRAAVRLDCRVEVEAEATVADLRRALLVHATAREVVVATGAVLWDDDAHPLRDDHLVSRTRLRSGSRVWLSPDPPPRRRVRATGGHQDGSGDVPFVRTPRRPPPPPTPAVAPMPAPPPRRRWPAVGPWPERTAYLATLDERVAELERAIERERAALHRAQPSFADLARDASERGPSLWARDHAEGDRLTVRLGTADARPGVGVAVEPGGDEALRALALDRLAAAGGVVRDAPVVLDLDDVASIALHGDPELVDGVARALLGQVVVGHGPDDVVVAALLAPAALRSFEWLRWLPHVRSSASPLTGEHLAAWPAATEEVLGSLLDASTGRRASPRVVVLVHEDAPADPDAIARLVEAAPEAGIRVLWVGGDADRIPARIGAVVRVGGGPGGSTLAVSTDPVVRFWAEGADARVLDRLARDLAPLRDATTVARLSSIPRVVGSTDVAGGTPAPADVATAWSLSDGGLLDAPVGTGAVGVVTLDLVEQGPHAVVAGASGSGRHELLRSWILALAARHPPERLTFGFLDVDVEGTAAARDFPDLPHSVGRVPLAAITALPAELDRRAALLGARGRRDLAELAAADPAGCPPRLVLVVDELARLPEEEPSDVLPALVDVVWRGGRLGVHLLASLATDRSTGPGIDDLLAGVDLRIALRADDPAQAQRIMGSVDAAAIPASLPGRGFVRAGSRDPVPFQAAWARAPRRPVEAGRVHVSSLGFGRREASAPRPPVDGTQGDDVLRAIALAFERSARTLPVAPWTTEG